MDFIYSFKTISIVIKRSPKQIHIKNERLPPFGINCSYFWYIWSITGAAPPNTSTINRSRRDSKTASLGRQHTRTLPRPHERVTTERFFPLAVRAERSHYFSRIYLRHRLSSALTDVSQNSRIVPAFMRLSNGLVGEVVNFRKRAFKERYIYWCCQLFPFHHSFTHANADIVMKHNKTLVIKF